MADPVELNWGNSNNFRVEARCTGGNQGEFTFGETFYESSDPRFDAVLLLGAQLNHDYNTPNQDVINSYMWNGFTHKSKAINRIFISEITVAHSIPSSRDDVFTEVDSAVTSLDFSWDTMPNIANDGVLAELRHTFIYEVQVQDIVNNLGTGAVYHYMRFSPLKWNYPDIECVKPIGFYHKTTGYSTVAKQAWVLWKVTAHVRFMASAKANPKFSKGISFGGVPG